MRMRLALVAALLLAPACAGPEVLDAVPDVRQSTDYSCGIASMVAVLRYYGVEADERTLIREAKVDPEVGARLDALVAVAQRRGLEARVHTGVTLGRLEREIAAGRPVIVLNQSWRQDDQLPWKDAWDDGHYLVVIGIDGGDVFVEDPALKGARGRIPRGEFVERWHCWTDDDEKVHGQAIFVSPPEARARAAATVPCSLPLERIE